MFSEKGLQCFVLLMVVLSFFTSSFIVEVHAAPDFWSITTLDPGDALFDSSLALDASGYPHISYSDYNYDHLKYARWTGSEWVIEFVDWNEGEGSIGTYPSLALDGSGYPHISYHREFYDEFYEVWYCSLKYARWTGSYWIIENVDMSEDEAYEDIVGLHTSLALDASGYPHISYYYTYYDDYFEEWYGALKYARWTGSEWVIEFVDSGGNVGRYPSLALDASGYPHISYYDFNDGSLKYAWWSGTNWNIDTIDYSGVAIGAGTSLALDASGYPHISYYYDYYDDLRYAQWTGVGWTTETVDSDGDVGRHSSLALGANGYPHISYYDQTNYALKYARWTGSDWAIETVNSDGDPGYGVSLALDASDHPHISSICNVYHALKYAFAPDEYFSDVDVTSFDGNGDGFDDYVTVAMDVDTTFSGVLDVTAYAYLKDAYGGDVGYDSSTWPIMGRVTELGLVFLYVSSGSSPGLYEVVLSLYDSDDNLEDSYTQGIWLSPPDMDPFIDSCTLLEVQTDSFELEETIYMMGTDYAPSTSFAVYVVVDTTWIDGMAIPSRVAGTATSIASNTGGDIEATAVWSSPLTLGRYDVIVDVNGNGVYDDGVDALDDSDIEVTAGVEVIPEFPVAMLVPIFVVFSLIAVVVKKRLLPRLTFTRLLLLVPLTAWSSSAIQ